MHVHFHIMRNMKQIQTRLRMAFNRVISRAINNFFLILIYDSMYDKSKAFFHFFLPNFLLSIVKMYRTPFNIQLAVVLATNSSQYTYMYTYINIDVVNKSIKLYKKIHEYI